MTMSDYDTKKAWQGTGEAASRALAQVSQEASSPSNISTKSRALHPNTRELVKVLVEGQALFPKWHDTEPREHMAAMLLFAEVVAGQASAIELRAALLIHAQHSKTAPKPADLLAITRINRPKPSDDEKLAEDEMRVRADNVRLATSGKIVRWHIPPNGKAEMFIPGAPGEMRACCLNGRVIAPMLKRGSNGSEWFVSREDARTLADAYSDTNAAYRVRGNVIVAVDADGNEWTHPDSDAPCFDRHAA